MSRLTSTTSSEGAASVARKEPVSKEARDLRDRELIRARRVCPFCGNPTAIDAPEGPCARCTMEDTPATRQATKSRIGPWHVLQTRNPSAPGMRFETLLSLIAKGQVTMRSIVRGPSTHQLWRFAGHVRGLSREFGLCFSCGEPIDRRCSICPHCERSQEIVGDPNALLEMRPEPRASGFDIDELGGDSVAYGGRLRASDRLNPPSERPNATPQLGATANSGRLSRGRVSAIDLATALQQNPSMLPLTRRSLVLRGLGVTVLLLAIGTAALMYLRPDYRQQTTDWLTTTWETSSRSVSSWIDGAVSRPDSPQAQPPAAVVGEVRVAPPVPPPPPRPQAQEQVQAPPTPRPETVAQPQPPRPVTVTPPPQETPPAAPVLTDLDAALAMSRDLYHRAIDAEGRRDYATAARLYEQMLKLPREVQYADVNVRLANVRRAMQAP